MEREDDITAKDRAKTTSAVDMALGNKEFLHGHGWMRGHFHSIAGKTYLGSIAYRDLNAARLDNRLLEFIHEELAIKSLLAGVKYEAD